MIHISAAQIAGLLRYCELADAIGAAFASDGIHVPQRVHVPVEDYAHRGVLLLMPAWRTGGLLGVKIVSVNSENRALGLPTVQGTLLITNAETGVPVATLDATEITRWRTAATSLLAARMLARPESAVLVLAGSGAVAQHLLSAYLEAFRLREVLVWSRTAARARQLVTDIAPTGQTTVTAVDDLEAAVRRADIVSSATLSEGGLIKGQWVKPGTHVDLVGAYTPRMRESDDDLILRAAIFVDTRATATREAGDLVQPLAAGLITESEIRGELRELVRRQCQGRESTEAITLFKSVGHALEDLVSAEMVLSKLGHWP